MRPTITGISALFACAAVVRCGDVSGPTGWVLQSAVITDVSVTGLDGTPLTGSLLPSDAVTIAVTSAGSSSCTRPGPVSVDTLFNQIRLEVHDWVLAAETACTRDLRPYSRRLLHTFFETGTWTVRVVGQSDTSVRVTVAIGDASEWQPRPARAVDLAVTALDGTPVPSVVPSATPIAITVTSVGSSMCSRPGPLATTAQGTTLSFDVTDWERFVPDPLACTDDDRPLRRTLLRTLLVPGTHAIRAVGASGEIVVPITVAASGS